MLAPLNVHPVKFFEKDSRAYLAGVYPVQCSPREMPLYLYFTGASLAFYCTGDLTYSTGEFEVNIPSGLNFYPVAPEDGTGVSKKTSKVYPPSFWRVYRACPVGMKYRTGVKS